MQSIVEIDIPLFIQELQKKMADIEENNPNPIGALHARTKQDAYYNGIRNGFETVIDILDSVRR